MKTSFKDILSGLDLTPEQKTAANLLLGDEKVLGKVDTELKGIQSEFSRGLDEQRNAVAAAKADKDAYYSRVDDWKKEQEKTLTTVQEQARKDREAANLYRARVDSLVQAGILDAEDIAGLPNGTPPTTPPNTPPTVTPPNTPPTTPPNSPQYVTQEESLQYIKLPAMLADLSAEHQSLTGKPLTNAQAIVDKALADKKTIRETWETMHDIPKIRTENATRAQAEHDAKIRAEERTKVMSELSNPTLRDPGKGYQSPVLAQATKVQPQPNSVPYVGSRQGVERAMAAHSAGKYEGGVVHP